MPAARRATVLALAEALAEGRVAVGPGADWGAARAALARVPGVGPWTVEMIAMRSLGDPDAFPAGDLGVVKGAERVGLPRGRRALAAAAEAWRPWRAYATQYLWATGDHPTNRLPNEGKEQ